MRIALITEGCYPFARGGVTTWCDQLVRGLPQHDFEVVALLANGSEPVIMPLPDNVSSVQRIPLWGPTTRSRPQRGNSSRVFEGHVHQLLSALLTDTPDELSHFVSSLRGLHAWAQRHDLRTALSSEAATKMVIELWQERSVHRTAHPMSLHDALMITDVLEHLLRPLSQPAPQVDLCHPVSNGLPTLVAMTAQWTYGTPMVMSEHGVFLRERYLALRDFKYAWPVKHVLTTFYRLLSEAGYAAAELIAPVNVFNQRWELNGGADPDRIVTAYNGVDSRGFEDVPEPVVPTVGWVGRIDPLKDLETLVRGFSIVREKVPGAKLRMFGPVPAGNEKYAQHVRSLVDRLAIGADATFEGPVSPVSAAYQQSSVVALTSISEGLPYTVIEAMMSRRATVSSDVGGVAEVVGDAGSLFPAREPEEFARACVKMLTDPDLRATTAAAARERAVGLFELDRMLGAFGGIYSGLLAQGRLDPVTSSPEVVSRHLVGADRVHAARHALQGPWARWDMPRQRRGRLSAALASGGYRGPLA